MLARPKGSQFAPSWANCRTQLCFAKLSSVPLLLQIQKTIPTPNPPTFAKRHEQIEAPKARRREACTKARRNVEQLKVTMRCAVDLKQKWQARRDSAKRSFSLRARTPLGPGSSPFVRLLLTHPTFGGAANPLRAPSCNFFPTPRAVPQRRKNVLVKP